ncbi:MAG: hypothetical protein HYU41_11750 [Candidatus Rokubacteria bacterium]|nr:hypothetical protein [Candidatus Rokubacteria bacterium]
MTQRDSFGEFEATSLFCPKCRRATPTRRKLLLVLSTGNKYDYLCAECGTAVGGKTDNDATDFYRAAPIARTGGAEMAPPPPGARRAPGNPGRPPIR